MLRPRAFLSLLVLAPLAPSVGQAPPLDPVVEVEEDVYSYEPPGNGAGPLWCHGSSCIVRLGDRVFASGFETLPDAKPLNNARWCLYERAEGGWRLIRKDERDRTREPSPLCALSDGRLLLSVNPTLTGPDSYAGPAEPRILAFAASDVGAAPRTLLPRWVGRTEFTEHSYRSFAADGRNCEAVLIQNVGYTHALWTFLDRDGAWSAGGRLAWPWGAEYPKPQPIRICYPTVALCDRAVHFCGVSDIVEPYPEWRAHKKQVTGRDWDYDFRRLFYTWSDDIHDREFHDWVEVSSRDKTGGWIFPCDLWAAPDGRVHLLWTERSIDERLREKFFPKEKQRIALEYAVLRGGKLLSRRPVAEWKEGVPGETPGNGRLQVTQDGRLFVFFFASGTDALGKPVSENRIVEIQLDQTADKGTGEAVRVTLEAPFTSFFTATPRSGSAPSSVLHVLGEGGKPATIRYARIRLFR